MKLGQIKLDEMPAALTIVFLLVAAVIVILWVAIPFILLDIRKSARKTNEMLDELKSEAATANRQLLNLYTIAYDEAKSRGRVSGVATPVARPPTTSLASPGPR